MDNDRFAKVQRVLAEPKRLEILQAVRRLGCTDGVMCGNVLREMDISQSTFSHHVHELASAEVILERKSGRCSLLSVNEAVVSEYLEELRTRMLG